MQFSRFIAAAGALVFALSCMSGPQATAAEVFKCRAPDGKLTFSDQPCTDEQTHETGKPAPPPGQVDVHVVCGPAPRTPADVSREAAACRQMRVCAAKKGDVACRVYCTSSASANGALRGVKFGPTSPSCLRYNNFVGGTTWVQTSARVNGAGYEMLPATCVDAEGRATRPVFLACEPGTANCAIEAPQRGRRLEPTPIDELMARTCGT